MQDNYKNIIEAWLRIEYLNTGKLKIKENTSKVSSLEGTTFSEGNFFLEDVEQYSVIYFGIFDDNDLEKQLCTLVDNGRKPIGEKKTLNYSLSVKVSNEGAYVENSIFIPQLQYMLKKIMGNEMDNIGEDELARLENEAVGLFEIELKNLFKEGFTLEKLLSVNEKIGNYFLTINLLREECYISFGVKNEIDFNSFLTSDLEKISKLDELPKQLKLYIDGHDQFKNIDENEKAIMEILNLENLPDGRWPSNNNFKLSLMQQVSVNLVLNEEIDIFSVNGPPGTGKTTLLKDIFANLVIKRACEMTKFSSPKEAYQNKGVVYSDVNNKKGYNFRSYQLDDSICGYSIVVASSNNSAVENISKDLPKSEELIHDNDRFMSSDKGFSESIKEVNYFPEYLSYIFDKTGAKKTESPFEKYWGLFSVNMGRSSNINQVLDPLLYGKESKTDGKLEKLNDRLKSSKTTVKEWSVVCEKFTDIKNQIEDEKVKITNYLVHLKKENKLIIKLNELDANLTILKNEMNEKQENMKRFYVKKSYLIEQKELLPRLSFFTKLMVILGIKVNESEEELKKSLSELNEKIRAYEIDVDMMKEQIKKIEIEKQENRIKQEKLSESLKEERLYFLDDEVDTLEGEWGPECYDKRQLTTPFVTKRLNYLRGNYFIQAMNVHKVFNEINSPLFWSALNVLKNRSKLDMASSEHKELLKQSWQIFHLLIPVVSTTFSSLGTMYKGLEEESIDYLFIDEAGQATPQAAAGGIWRAKRVIAVGDPSQIEPVLGIDPSILGIIKEKYQIEDHYAGEQASVQKLADYANKYGTVKPDKSRIGVPLWVHRRCLSPIFNISNEISYEGKMVQGVSGKEGTVRWFDIKGKATDKYVLEQSQCLLEELKKATNLSDIYIISPFKNVVDKTKEFLRENSSYLAENEGIKIKDWINKSIGTVHTFQGKEAPIVYFICGTDIDSEGAANWSCQTANIINVAVTRAKKEFYIIGDYSRFSGKPFYQTLAKYSENPIKNQPDEM
ncbi:DEAD/DEAH box helicase [Vagococcus intermedius]|uniref:AAA domain-containing protein n=1 Tax=Vagococcus intermedius TaxID=2991418 RepID=A0AAF0CVV4_9ENTE|nr:AAA domain-containing protein [Vagococcus intermedius]WEG73975.1 AAA domain-containing protein [Vagococcus intermedius]WEG76055.1 AAA domain-containing protein [Vagococcus intermedius]